MNSDKNDQFTRKDPEEPDEWEEFRGEDGDPIGVKELERLDLEAMPEDIHILVWDNYFPETTVSREGDFFVCEIQEHLYTKYWEHKFSAYAFAEAMERAVRRLAHEGHPFANPTRDDEDVHIFVRWQIRLLRITPPKTIVESIKSAFDLVWQRADSILENSDSVLVLGKDTGAALARLKRIESKLQELGYYTYIIKEQPDKAGESIIQKVMRYALSSKFVLIENTEASGHLYEIPHVTKAAECVTVVLQEEGKGATWMFEDAYAKHKHWHKLTYLDKELENAVEQAALWAEKFVGEFADYQAARLPWVSKR
ncbi:MAG: hypothetical protein ACLQVJ_15000 [Syntrophobacteraceae bacterium]